jgi:hypothetical protein
MIPDFWTIPLEGQDKREDLTGNQEEGKWGEVSTTRELQIIKRASKSLFMDPFCN